MYAVVQTGGKQHVVREGELHDVESLGVDPGTEVRLTPVLLCADGVVTARRTELEGAVVAARVVGSGRGPKIRGFTYKPKTRGRRHWGHRQAHDVIEIVSISPAAASGAG